MWIKDQKNEHYINADMIQSMQIVNQHTRVGISYYEIWAYLAGEKKYFLGEYHYYTSAHHVLHDIIKANASRKKRIYAIPKESEVD